MMKNRIGKVVCVEWLDSCVSEEDGPWHNWREYDFVPVTCITVGHVLTQDTRSITVAGTVSGEQAAGIMTIPLGCVTKIKEV